jgi:hypothetical protein
MRLRCHACRLRTTVIQCARSILPRKFEEIPMKKMLSVLVLACGFLSLAAHAADAGCEAKAAEKNLVGAAKASFMKKCEADAGAGADSAKAACEAQAGEKKLAGAAKSSFVKKCAADDKAGAKSDAAKTASAGCETQAGEKKLVGAAKNSFVKKCTAEATK